MCCTLARLTTVSVNHGVGLSKRSTKRPDNPRSPIPLRTSRAGSRESVWRASAAQRDATASAAAVGRMLAGVHFIRAAWTGRVLGEPAAGVSRGNLLAPYSADAVLLS